MDRIQPITDVPTLQQLLQVAKTAHTLDEVRVLATPTDVEDDSADPPSAELS
jgi:hypothetical protein